MTTVIIDSYSESNSSSEYSLNTTYAGLGQSFTASECTLNSSKFYIKKSGSPTGNIYSKIYAHTGTYGTSSLPTGTALATSDAINVSTLSTSLTLTTFVFSGVNNISLTNSTNYVITIEFNATSVVVGADASSPTHSGNGALKTTSWSGTSSDFCFYVYGDVVALGPTNLKTYNTNVKANIKTINTNPIANVKSFNTNT